MPAVIFRLLRRRHCPAKRRAIDDIPATFLTRSRPPILSWARSRVQGAGAPLTSAFTDDGSCHLHIHQLQAGSVTARPGGRRSLRRRQQSDGRAKSYRRDRPAGPPSTGPERWPSPRTGSRQHGDSSLFQANISAPRTCAHKTPMFGAFWSLRLGASQLPTRCSLRRCRRCSLSTVADAPVTRVCHVLFSAVHRSASEPPATSTCAPTTSIRRHPMVPDRRPGRHPSAWSLGSEWPVRCDRAGLSVTRCHWRQHGGVLAAGVVRR